MKKQTGFTLIELMIVIAIAGILVAVIAGALGFGQEDRCKELCEGLNHRMVKVTSDYCICEDPDTKSRQAYPILSSGEFGAPMRPATRAKILEQED